MPLQNRVNPFGEIIADPARGMFMGNRGGRIHNLDKTLSRRRWASKQWIICQIEFKGRKRELMAPGSYTELFFLDEVTALAAGHRPCAECRREAFNDFKAAWVRAFGSEREANVRTIDACLHEDRVMRNREQVRYYADDQDLPDGIFVEIDGAPWLIKGSEVFRWTPSGYVERRDRSSGTQNVLTPLSTVQVIAAGYEPIVYLA